MSRDLWRNLHESGNRKWRAAHQQKYQSVPNINFCDEVKHTVHNEVYNIFTCYQKVPTSKQLLAQITDMQNGFYCGAYLIIFHTTHLLSKNQGDKCKFSQQVDIRCL